MPTGNALLSHAARALALALGLCVVPATAWSAPPSAAKLTIAVSKGYIGSALVLIASTNGYFKDAGLDVEFQSHKTGADALDASLVGKADLATTGEVPVMFATMRGTPVSVIATISTSGEDYGIVARSDSGISRVIDLKGKRVAATPGTSGHYLLDAMLIANGLPHGAVEFVALPADRLSDALSARQVDAVSTWEPYLSRTARNLGGAAAIFLREKHLYASTFNIAGRREFVHRHPEVIERLLRALFRAERFVGQNPGTARAIVASATGIDPQDVDRIWPMYKLALKLEQRFLIMLESTARWAIRYGYVEKRPIPNFLDSLYPDAMLAVNPHAMSVIR